MISEKTKGIFAITATPFRDDGALDLDSADSLIERTLETGVHGLTILGIMGEANKLSTEESVAFTQHVMARVAGRVPVVVGVSAMGSDNLVDLSQRSMDLGAAGVMIAPPPILKTEVQIHGYFSELFGMLGDAVPVCYQDYPTTTAVHISVPTFNRLVDDFPQLVMLKMEDFPGLKKLTQVIESAEPQGRRRVSILGANGGLYYPLELRRGADGAMTGFAYPEMLVRVYDLFTKGEIEAAEDLFDLYLPIVRYEFQLGLGLAIRKEILRRRGFIKSSKVRAPGPKLDARDHEELEVLMRRLEARIGG